jgi:hypothetical protein
VLRRDEPAPLTGDDKGGESEAETKSPWVRTFGAEDLGKILYFAMRWENFSSGTGQAPGKGPWSAIKSVSVP